MFRRDGWHRKAIVKTATPFHAAAVIECFDRLSVTGDWSRLYEVVDGRTYHFHIRRMRALELLPARLGRVADIGCGPGVMVEAVRSRGGTYEGVDISPEMVRESNQRFGRLTGVSFRTGTIEALDLPSGAYDQAICMAVIEYLRTPDRALAEIARILRPGGQAIITVPKQWHIDRVTVATTTPIRAMGRACGLGTKDALPRLRLQPDELNAAARRAGLSVDGGAQYHFTLLPYPLPRIAPRLCMRLNLPYERWHATRRMILSFFAHGYVGRYRKPGEGDLRRPVDSSGRDS
jgi:SAM-dependent methyltransferase